MEIDGLMYSVSVECVIMIAENAEVTAKFKAIESAPPIKLVIRSVMQAVVGKANREMLDIEEDINGAKRTYEI